MSSRVSLQLLLCSTLCAAIGVAVTRIRKAHNKSRQGAVKTAETEKNAKTEACIECPKGLEEPEECSICLTELGSKDIAACQGSAEKPHRFHRHCAEQWARKGPAPANNRCPICRGPFEVKPSPTGAKPRSSDQPYPWVLVDLIDRLERMCRDRRHTGASIARRLYTDYTRIVVVEAWIRVWRIYCRCVPNNTVDLYLLAPTRHSILRLDKMEIVITIVQLMHAIIRFTP